MQRYLQKHAHSEALIKEIPSEDIAAVVIIPAYFETKLFETIHSLFRCHVPAGTIEIIPVLNHPHSADTSIQEFHQKQYHGIIELAKQTAKHPLQVRSISPISLPDKQAGVGMARKIGMDEAVRRFEYWKKDGIIINIDADCSCDKSYFKEILAFHHNYPEIEAVSIGFHHDLQIEDIDLRDAIILYELHLRTYIGWQKYFGYPFAYQTLGSCFSVRSYAYQAMGGMNKRKAGEDFYFLHKFSVLSRLSELKKALVIPSGRISDRVPFGTGRAVSDIVLKNKIYKTYNPEAIRQFCLFMKNVESSYYTYDKDRQKVWNTTVESLHEFLVSMSFDDALQSVLDNCAGAVTFQKQIRKWFNPFRLMKYLHYAREREYPDCDVLKSARDLLNCHSKDYSNASPEEILHALRLQDYPEGL